MKKTIPLMLLFVYSTMSYASMDAMYYGCQTYGGVYEENLTVDNYYILTSEEIVGVNFNNRSSASVTPFTVHTAGYIYDMAKKAMATGEKVNACFSKNKDYLVGLEWSV